MTTATELRGVSRRLEPMARHTVWGVGGPADLMYLPADLEDLRTFLRHHLGDEPCFWLGLGSNLLVRDGGLRGVVINVHGRLNRLELLEPGRVRAEAGVPSAKLARFAARAGLAGAAFFAGIPGTVGGALAMNAGAFGGETWERVTAVETLDRSGTLRRRDAAEFEVGYRRVAGPAGEWFVAAHLHLPAGDADSQMEAIRDTLRQRADSQPTGQRSCGSVFKNPRGDHAGRLIDAADLKGARVGAAVVSMKHANFIINEGAATADDIEALIERVKARVLAREGIELVPEVRIVGERASGSEHG